MRRHLVAALLFVALAFNVGAQPFGPRQPFYPISAAEVAAAVTGSVRDMRVDVGDVRRYGADLTGVADSASAINAATSQAAQAGGRIVTFPAGTFLIASKITIPASVTLRGEGPQTVVKKGFNGDMFEVGSFASMLDMSLDGQSGSFTGRGVIITSGTNPSGGRQYFHNIRISNTASFNVEYTADGVGFGSLWSDSRFSIPSNNIVTIKLPTDTGTGNRHFVGVVADADSLIDLGGSANTNITGSFSGRSVAGGLWCIVWGSGSSQSVISGNRLAGGGQTGHIQGTLHALTGNAIAGDIVFDSGTTSNKLRGNQHGSGTITDSSGSVGTSANEFDSNVVSYNPTWTGSGSNPVLGNGTLNGSYTRNGREVLLSFRLVIGSTTTMGSGTWRFSLPFTSHTRSYLCDAYILDSGTNFLVAVGRLNEGGATFVELVAHAGATLVTPTVPITFTTNDEIWVSCQYDVSIAAPQTFFERAVANDELYELAA